MATSSEDAWSLILADIKKQHNSLYAMLRMASPELEPGHIRLIFAFPFHKQKMEEDANKQIIRQIAMKHLKEDVRISTAVESKSTPTTSPKQEEPDIAAVIKVMGGGEPSTMEDNL